MSRFGGAASVGHMWTEGEVVKYDDGERRMSTGTKTALAGLGAGALGAHQLAGSRHVEEMAANRARRAEEAYQPAKRAFTTAQDAAYDAKVAERLTPGGKVLHRRKVKRTQKELDAAGRKYEGAKRARASAQAANTPGEIARAVKNKRIMGGTLLAGGALAAASPLFRRRPQPAPIEPVAYAKADVSKTITQARYGGVVESGRRWRGEEKKDRKARDAAIGAGAVGVGGGITGAVGHRKLKSIGPLADIKAHERSYVDSVSAVDRVRDVETKSLKNLERARVQHGNYAGGSKTWKARNKHPYAGQPAPGYPGIKARAATAKSPAMAAVPGGIVGVQGGGFKEHEAHLRSTYVERAKEGAKAGAARDTARQQLEGARTHNATHAPRVKAATRLRRAGAGIAAAGGLAALAAGIKAERDRKPYAKVRKGLPVLLPLRAGLAASKVVTPKPVRNVVRGQVKPFKEGWNDAVTNVAVRRAYKDAGMAAPKPVWAR